MGLRRSGYVLIEHARERLLLRGLAETVVGSVLGWPDSHRVVRPGRVVFQARRRFPPDGKVYLVRVVVDLDRHPPEIVSAYRTTSFEKYEGPPP